MSSRIKRAVISVWDKRGLAPFAKELASQGIEILSTGGTAKFLQENGINATELSDITGFHGLFGGRVKTLHSNILGGILYQRGNRQHEDEAREKGIRSLDMVVVNLYPFEKVAAKEGVKIEEAIENIDIGGSALLRAAAKNHKHVVVVTDPNDYHWVADFISKKTKFSDEKLRELALKAFARTSHYDAAICRYFSRVNQTDLFPDFLQMCFERAYPLRYGENPNQLAAAYRILGRTSIFDSKIHSGSKSMSYNNFLDADSAFTLIRELKDQVATVILKHNNPCGAAQKDTLEESYRKAHEGDPLSSFGGILAFSRNVDVATAKAVGSKYIEVVLAPSYDEDALEVLKMKHSRRIMNLSNIWDMSVERAVNFRYITGGMLYQGRDPGIYEESQAIIPTQKKPTNREEKDAYFATKLVKHTKSNAITIAKDLQLIGVGAGQMSRIDSTIIAVKKAHRNGFDLKGSVAASDAFFPFRDSIDELAQAGISCIVQPGGSIRDSESIKAADEHGISMIITGRRHFRH